MRKSYVAPPHATAFFMPEVAFLSARSPRPALRGATVSTPTRPQGAARPAKMGSGPRPTTICAEKENEVGNPKKGHFPDQARV